MNTKFILFENNTNNIKKDYSYVIMQEAFKINYVKLYEGAKWMEKKYTTNFYNLVCKNNLFLSRIWYRLYFLNTRLIKGEPYIWVFSEWHPIVEKLEIVQWIKRKYKIRTVLIIRNMIVNKKYPTVRNISLIDLMKSFDLVITDEKKDAYLYHLCFLPDPFSVITKRKTKTKVDICFSGKDKGRAELLSLIAEKAEDSGVVYDFRIMEKKVRYMNLQYSEYQPYIEIIKQDMSSNCILEVLQSGQDSCTLRLQEAVCLGKKLLTNNQNVIKEKYYNPQYIHIFNKIDDIDWNFVIERTHVDYGYEGEYSPIHFLKKIDKKLNMNRIGENYD